MFLFVILSLNDKLCQIPLVRTDTKTIRKFKENKAFGLLPLNKAPTPEKIQRYSGRVTLYFFPNQTKSVSSVAKKSIFGKSARRTIGGLKEKATCDL